MELTGDYRSILRAHLAARCQRNPRYTMRAFAKDLRLDPARLSDILNEKKGLSGDAALVIARRLGMSADESERFRDLAEAQHARSKSAKVAARARLAEKAIGAPKNLSLEAFKIVQDWHHFAILHLMKLKEYRQDFAWIGKRLGISQHQVRDAIERLERLEMIELKGGRHRAVEDHVFTANGIPSAAIREHHEQILKKASQALQVQPLERREFQSLMLAMDSARLPEFKKRVRAFIEDACRDFSADGGAADSVYQCSVQLFGLTDEEIKGVAK